MATFNIRHGTRTAGGRVDIRLLQRTCAGLDVDVLALQEVDVRMRRTWWADTPARVARATGMSATFGPALRRGLIGRYGNGLFADGTVADVDVVGLPGRSGEPRAALLATVTARGLTVSVAATHLSTQRDERDEQLAAVVSALTVRPLPHVLLGDFNGTLDEVAPIVESGTGLRLTAADPTFPADKPRAQIDHVAVAGLDVVSAFVPATPVSDHRPLVVELRARR